MEFLYSSCNMVLENSEEIRVCINLSVCFLVMVRVLPDSGQVNTQL